ILLEQPEVFIQRVRDKLADHLRVGPAPLRVEMGVADDVQLASGVELQQGHFLPGLLGLMRRGRAGQREDQRKKKQRQRASHVYLRNSASSLRTSQAIISPVRC